MQPNEINQKVNYFNKKYNFFKHQAMICCGEHLKCQNLCHSSKKPPKLCKQATIKPIKPSHENNLKIINNFFRARDAHNQEEVKTVETGEEDGELKSPDDQKQSIKR